MSEIRQGNLNDLSTERDFGASCLNAFLTELGDDLTGACMVPVNLPQREIMNIVKRAKKWFYKNYEDAVRENYFVVPTSVFDSDYFKNHRSLNLPNASADGSGSVFSVFGVYDTGSGFQSAGSGLDVRFQSGGDFALEKMLFRGMYEGAGSAEAAEELQYYVLNQSLADMSRMILENPISYNYSRLTGELKILGDKPKTELTFV